MIFWKHYLANLSAMVASVWESIARGRHIGSTGYWAVVEITNGWTRKHQVWRRRGTKGTKILDVHWFRRFGGQRGWRGWGSQLKSLNKTNTINWQTKHSTKVPERQSCLNILTTWCLGLWTKFIIYFLMKSHAIHVTVELDFVWGLLWKH